MGWSLCSHSQSATLHKLSAQITFKHLSKLLHHTQHCMKAHTGRIKQEQCDIHHTTTDTRKSYLCHSSLNRTGHLTGVHQPNIRMSKQVRPKAVTWVTEFMKCVNAINSLIFWRVGYEIELFLIDSNTFSGGCPK